MSTRKPTIEPQQILTSTVLAVILRVTGQVHIDVRPHALGTPERQVTARIGDVLLYLTDPRVASRIRQRWDAAQPLATRLPERVSQTWLAPRPDTYPVGVTLQLTGAVSVDVKPAAARPAVHQPAHLLVHLDGRLIWQVCDVQAWRTIGDAWLAAEHYLEE